MDRGARAGDEEKEINSRGLQGEYLEKLETVECQPVPVLLESHTVIVIIHSQ